MRSTEREKDIQRGESYDVIVIGGGASGLMAAATAGLSGRSVLLLEKNAHLGEKLKISGGGRCNVTNAEYDLRKLLSQYGKAEPFLYSAFSQFNVKDTFSFFEGRGLPLVVEERLRAFPKTHKALDVLRVLEDALREGKVVVKKDTPVIEIQVSNHRITGVRTQAATYHAKAYIIATGGVSHPETGSTGDGFAWLQTLGHTVITPTPSIVPLATKEDWSHELKGVTLPNVKVRFSVDGKKVFIRKGPLLFTHFGVSGPLILNASAAVSDLLHEGEVTLTVDCFPERDEGALEAHILSIFDTEKNKLLKNVFRTIAPPGTGTVLLTLLPNIDQEKKVHSVTKEERKAIVKLLKGLPLTIQGLMGLDMAVIADGGVPMEEIDTKSMRSAIIPNLFLTGDLLHVRRPSGGFSLQLCWTTGFVAGTHA